MALGDQARSTLADVDHAIAAAEREVGRQRTEQLQHFHDARWNEAKQLDRTILEWRSWADSLTRYRTLRLAADGGADAPVVTPPMLTIHRQLAHEFERTVARLDEANQPQAPTSKLSARDIRGLFDLALERWSALDRFCGEALALTRDVRFAAVPRSPMEDVRFTSLAFDRREVRQLGLPDVDRSRWADVFVAT